MSIKDDVTDLETIVSELIRYLEMPIKERISSLANEGMDSLFCQLDLKDGKKIHIGRKAEDCFSSLSRRLIEKTEDLQNRVSIETVKKVIKFKFVEYGLTEKKIEFDAAFVNRLLEKSKNYLIERKLVTRQYAIPCNLVYNKEPHTFSIGPVTFFKTEYWLESNKSVFEGDNNSQVLLSSCREIFEKHTWVATVEIEKTDKNIGLQRANLAIISALNVIRLFAPKKIGSKFHLAGQKQNSTTSAYLIRENEKTSPTWNRNFGAMFEEGQWKEFINREDAFRNQAGSTLLQITNAVEQLPLVDRFLDALYWYGDAVQEENGGALITKCAAALERLTIVERNPDNISDLFSTRAAFLISHLKEQDVKNSKISAKELYETRSRLMHGGTSPFRFNNHFGEYTALELTRNALLGALYFYWTLNKGKISNKELENAFLNGVSKMKSDFENPSTSHR